jgi:DNA repair protein RadD
MLTPRWYQSGANAAVWNYLANESGNCIAVLPTGAGKSLLAALLIEQALKFDGRVVILAHRKELLEQNAEEIRGLVPGVDVGIYSAGLKSRNVSSAVIVGGIQSIYKKANELGDRHLIIIDECHLCSEKEESMYGQFIAEMKINNPKLRIVGMSATPFRTGEGPLCGRTKLFQRIVFESFTGDLIDQGFLCPITNKAADAEVNTEGIKTRGGEFIESDMQAIFGSGDNVTMAVQETIAKCHDRKSILVFTSGVKHAEQVSQLLAEETGERVGLITGETLAIERAGILADFKNQDLRWLVNCDVLTTGFNAKSVDAIAIMRATMSPGLFAQIVGRGLRLHPEKTNCLILDFGENIKRHGSIDDKNFGRASEAKRGQAARAAALNGRGKPCPACGLDVPANDTECECGFIFPAREARHNGTSDSNSQLTGQMPPEVWTVVSASWCKHTKRHDPDAPPTLRVDYECRPADSEGGLLTTKVSEWVCFEHSGFAHMKAVGWWQNRSLAPMPETVAEAISMLNRGAGRMSAQITTVKKDKYTHVQSCKFADEIPTEWMEEIEEKSFGEFSGVGDDVPF